MYLDSSQQGLTYEQEDTNTTIDTIGSFFSC